MFLRAGKVVVATFQNIPAVAVDDVVLLPTEFLRSDRLVLKPKLAFFLVVTKNMCALTKSQILILEFTAPNRGGAFYLSIASTRVPYGQS